MGNNDENVLHLNAKIPFIKDKFELVQEIYRKEKDIMKASQAEVFRWLIQKEIERHAS
jgi:hypothetical protein